MTPDEAAKLEAGLKIKPDDPDTRVRLISHYSTRQMRQECLPHLLWMIESHPGHQFLYVFAKAFKPSMETPATAWIQSSDPETAETLFTQARQLNPAAQEWGRGLASLYTLAILMANGAPIRGVSTPELARRAQGELLASSDALVAGSVGLGLSRSAVQDSANLAAVKELGERLLERARALDPQNQDWSPNTPKPSDGQPMRIRVGGNVQATKLVNQPKPVYPPLAKSARIQGTVRFTATIAQDGKISHLEVVSGHPLLIPAAQTALKQWEYQPTLLNGDPVEVVTQVALNFQLP